MATNGNHPQSIKQRTYALPDWGRIDTVWRRAKPFVLWKVGEQCLLYHWLDEAVNQGIEKVVLLVADRPADVRRAMEEATLWPLDWEVRPVRNPAQEIYDDWLDRLPGDPPITVPEDGWALIRHWSALEQSWLMRFQQEIAAMSLDLGIGRGCDIHPQAQLKPPYWIGDYVSIGPRCIIGPGAVIGDGAMVGAGAKVANSHIGDGTYLGQETDLVDAVLEGATLLNLRHQARVDRLEAFIASGVTPQAKADKPTWSERWLALRLWWHWRNTSPCHRKHTFTGFDGRQWTLGKEGHLSSVRRTLLKMVWLGKMRLFGPLPRPAADLEALPDGFADPIRHAPPGAFSYADCMGATPGSMEEALHTAFMLTDTSGQSADVCRRWLEKLLAGDS